jgi:hypothetical protein
MNFGLVPFFLSMIPLLMVDPKEASAWPLMSAGVGFGLLVACLVGMGIIGMMRKSIVSASHFADTLEKLKQAHEASTGQPLLRVVPLTKVKHGSSVFELDR